MIAPGQGQGPAVSSAVRSSGPSGIAGHDDEDGPTMIAPGDDVDEDAETLRPGQQSLAQAIAAANKMGVATPGLTAGHDDRTLMPGQASLDKIKASLQQQGDAAGAAIAATLALNVNQGGQLSGQGRPQPGQQGGSRPRLPGVQQPDELTDMTDELEEASEFTSKPFQPPPGSNPSQPPPGNTPFQPPPGIAPPPGVNMPNSMPMRAQPVPYGSSQQLLAAPGPPGWMQQEPAKSTPVWLIVVAFLISVGVGMGVTILIAN
jgi:hypothetical protein